MPLLWPRGVESKNSAFRKEAPELDRPAARLCIFVRPSVRPWPVWDLQGPFLARYPGDKDPQPRRLRRDDSDMTEDYHDATRAVRRRRSRRRTDDSDDDDCHDYHEYQHYHDAEKSNVLINSVEMQCTVEPDSTKRESATLPGEQSNLHFCLSWSGRKQ